VEERQCPHLTSYYHSKSTKFTPSTIIPDMLLFNADAWPHDSNSLANFGSEEIRRILYYGWMWMFG